MPPLTLGSPDLLKPQAKLKQGIQCTKISKDRPQTGTLDGAGRDRMGRVGMRWDGAG